MTSRSSPILAPRYMEKDYLQSLNDRFASYVSRVRQMREQSGRMETVNLVNTTKILEDEIISLKGMYERQLEELRNKLEDMARERTQHQLAAAKNSALVAELQDKWELEFSDKIWFLLTSSMVKHAICLHQTFQTCYKWNYHGSDLSRYLLILALSWSWLSILLWRHNVNSPHPAFVKPWKPQCSFKSTKKTVWVTIVGWSALKDSSETKPILCYNTPPPHIDSTY